MRFIKLYLIYKDVQPTDETLVSVEPTSNPSLVQKTEAGDYTYTAGFPANLFYHKGVIEWLEPLK